MPYLRLETSVAVSDEKAGHILKELSAAVAQVTGKAESRCQVSLTGGVRMLMAGNAEPTAHAEVREIHFPVDHARSLSERVCALLQRELGIPGSRVYLTFISFEGAMWGVDGTTL